MRFDLTRTLMGCLILGCALPLAAEPAPAAKQSGTVRQINRRGNVTEIVIHNPRAAAKPGRSVEKTTPAPSLSATNFQEVNVQAPRLAPVTPTQVNRNSNPTAGVTWSQDWEPGPTAQMAANRGGTFGVSIVPTYPIYPYPYWGGGYASPYYGPAYYSGVSYNAPGYSAYYGPGYSNYSYSSHVGVNVFRGGGRHHSWYR